MRTRPRLLAVGAASAVALLLGACGAADEADPEPTTLSPVGTTPADETPAETTPSPTSEGVRAEFTIRDGAVDGPGRVEVPQGETVVLLVTSDVDDEVHVHGYDILAEAAAGETVTVEFVADAPGVFEVELEQNGLKLTDLQVGG